MKKKSCSSFVYGGVAVRMSWTFGDGGEAECGTYDITGYMGE